MTFSGLQGEVLQGEVTLCTSKLTAQSREKSASLRRLFLPISPLGWALAPYIEDLTRVVIFIWNEPSTSFMTSGVTGRNFPQSVFFSPMKNRAGPFFPQGKNWLVSSLARLTMFTESYCTTPGVGVALAFGLASACINVKVFRTSLFSNPTMDLVHVWYDDGSWSRILHSTIPTPIHDLKVKVTDLEFLC